MGELEEGGHCQQGPGEGATTFRRAKKRFFSLSIHTFKQCPSFKAKEEQTTSFSFLLKKKNV